MAKGKKKTQSKTLKDETVRFRASVEEKKALEEAARRDGLPLSAWLRRLSLQKAGALPEAK